MKRLELYTVRNASGQFLGTYRTVSAARAIQALRDEQAQTASFFRGQIAKGLDNLTATIEPKDQGR
jgi:hypothetical protein